MLLLHHLLCIFFFFLHCSLLVSFSFFFFNDTATTEIYTLSLHDALPIFTDQLLENVLAIGYNGNARGLPNRCDSSVPGSCGCIHSEMNALVKAPGSVRDKVVFISASPCVMCAKLIINSGVTHVFYRKAYRDPSGIEVLEQGRVVPVLYDRWVGEWR